MFAVPLAGELHASVTSRGFPSSPRRRRQRCRALCDLQQLHPDTCVPGDCMYSHSRKTHTNKRRHTDDVKTILCVFTTGVSPGGGAAAHAALRLARRSQQLQQVRGQRLVRPTPSQLPGVPQQDSDRLQRDAQRLLHGLPEAVRMLHTTLCDIFVRNVYFCLKIILVSFCFSASQFLVNTTSPLQTSRGKTFSTPSGRTSPQVSPQTNTHLQSSLQFSDFLARFVDFR